MRKARATPLCIAVLRNSTQPQIKSGSACGAHIFRAKIKQPQQLARSSTRAANLPGGCGSVPLEQQRADLTWRLESANPDLDAAERRCSARSIRPSPARGVDARGSRSNPGTLDDPNRSVAPCRHLAFGAAIG